MNFSALAAFLSILAYSASASFVSSEASDSCLYASSSSDLSTARVCARALQDIEAQPNLPAASYYESLAQEIRAQAPLWFNPSTQAEIAKAFCKKYGLSLQLIYAFGTGTKYPSGSAHTMKPYAAHYRAMGLNKGVYSIDASDKSARYNFIMRQSNGEYMLVELVGDQTKAPLEVFKIKKSKIF